MVFLLPPADKCRSRTSETALVDALRTLPLLRLRRGRAGALVCQQAGPSLTIEGHDLSEPLAPRMGHRAHVPGRRDAGARPVELETGGACVDRGQRLLVRVIDEQPI